MDRLVWSGVGSFGFCVSVVDFGVNGFHRNKYGWFQESILDIWRGSVTRGAGVMVAALEGAGVS